MKCVIKMKTPLKYRLDSVIIKYWKMNKCFIFKNYSYKNGILNRPDLKFKSKPCLYIGTDFCEHSLHKRTQ